MPMETEAPAKPEESLAREFSKLWASEPAGPDVFTFLSARPEISDDLRLDVLLVDQRERWARRVSLPLRVYLSAFPEIAANGEMVRALVDGERAERRKKLGGGSSSRSTPILSMRCRRLRHSRSKGAERRTTRKSKCEGPAPLGWRRSRSIAELEPTGLRSTRSPTNVNPTEEQLSFAIDEAYHLQSEAETLRAMLNTVRFTLVRRLGAGGMGVVYETYDQQRGELVALKTMRRVDPGALGAVQARVPIASRYHASQPGEPLRAVRG